MRTSDKLGLLKPFVDRLLTSFCREDSATVCVALSSPAENFKYPGIRLDLINTVSLRNNVVA